MSRRGMTAKGRTTGGDGEGEIDLTPMLDVVFIMLIFFIVTSSFVKEPGIDIELIASNSTSDLKRREADIAVRAFRPTQPDLIVKKLKDQHIRLYATEDYLEGIGNPSTADEFSNATFIGFDRSERLISGLNELGFQLDQSHL